MFQIEPHSGADKSFKIFNKKLDISMELDYDDVDHERVDCFAELLTQLLNDNLEWLSHSLEE